MKAHVLSGVSVGSALLGLASSAIPVLQVLALLISIAAGAKSLYDSIFKKKQ